MAKTVSRIFIFRHGQTEWNREGRIQGHLDVPLNETGRNEGIRLARSLRLIRLDAILSSDLSRARHTAEIALAEAIRHHWHPEVPILSDARFREVHLGKLQGLTKSEIREKFGDIFAGRLGSKVLSDEELRDIGSEKAETVISRFFDGLDQGLASLSPGATVGVSTHGGVVRRLLHHGAGIEEIPAPVPNAALFQFEYDPRTRLFRFVAQTDFRN